MKRFWRLIAWIAGLAVVVVLLSPVVSNRFTTGDVQENSGGGRRGGGGRAGGQGAGAAIPVLVAPAASADVPVYIEGVGTGRALNTVLIRPQVDGTLLKLGFIEGQDVKTGDLIAQIDPRLYQATLDQAVAKKAQDEALLANARVDLDRYIKLSLNNSVTKQQADTQRATVAQDEAQVRIDQAMIDSARTNLGYTNIVSPIDGRTGIRNVDVGALLHASDTTGIVTVSQIQPVAVYFFVPQQQLGRINLAVSQGALQSDALGGDDGNTPIETGKLEVVDNTIDATTGTVRLKAVFPNKKLQIWPGAFVNVRLKVETLKAAVIVPVSAIQRGPKGSFVYVVADGEAKIRDVTPGQQDDKQAVVTAGLKAGDVVVTTGFARLTDGAKVTAGADPAAAAPGAAPALHQEMGTAPPSPDNNGRRGRRDNGGQSRSGGGNGTGGANGSRSDAAPGSGAATTARATP
jgi:multidrug efflux system membrane fusion protein